MQRYVTILKEAILLILFWILCFNIHRVVFSIFHFKKVFANEFSEFLKTLVHSFRLDLATASALTVIPMLLLFLKNGSSKRGFLRAFHIVVFILTALICLVHAGETVAYSEWNHKLTSRVFMHLSHPDEVGRTASGGMVFWYILFFIIEFACMFFLYTFLFKKRFKANVKEAVHSYLEFSSYVYVLFGSILFILVRGWNQIPLNIDSAAFSNKSLINDISINSNYYLFKSYLLYKRGTIDGMMPKVDSRVAEKKVKSWYTYPKDSSEMILSNTRPNVVFIILESWSAEAVGCLGQNKGATPGFDRLAKQGVLFSNVYATATTSENGNSSIFSGNPVIPEISITMQPEKHRNLNCINKDMEGWGYHSNYIFSGDLKYGNIGSYFQEHGFKVVKDESDFPANLPRGKLNFYDKDLYRFLIKEINSHSKPFLQCAFTGSTHSPYDQPKGKGKVFKGEESDFMNSVVYADNCLEEFIEHCKKQAWYKNTLFVFVADHGHNAPGFYDPTVAPYFRIPLLFYGEVIKKEHRGRVIKKVGSQSDIAATLIHQMNGDRSRYPWSKDLLNPKAPEFAFFTFARGFGWVTPKGAFNYSMENKKVYHNTFANKDDFQKEFKNAGYLLNQLYLGYKKL